jgi:hypothetical protein
MPFGGAGVEERMKVFTSLANPEYDALARRINV